MAEELMSEKKRFDKFLIELAKLTRETGVVISGCGCCGSPDIHVAEPGEIENAVVYGYGYAGQVEWLASSGNEKYLATVPKEQP